MKEIMIGCVVAVFLIYLYFVLSSRYRIKVLLSKNKKDSSSIFTGGELVRASAVYLGIKDLDVQFTEREFCDCYIPSKKLIVLSKDYCFSNSISAIAVASHELGHAMQHNRFNLIWVLYNLFIFLSKVSVILFLPILIALIVMFFGVENMAVSLILLEVLLGVVACVLLCKVLIIPCELNASNIALNYLKKNDVLKPSELVVVKKILKTAALTYVVGLFDGFQGKKY